MCLVVLTLVFSWSWMTRNYNELWAYPPQYLMFWKDRAPQYSKVNCHLAREYNTRGQYALARPYYEQCLTPDSLPSRIEYHASLGIMDLQEGKLASAKQHLQEALRLDPRSLSMYTHLGIIDFKEGDLERAEKLFLVHMQDKFAVLPRLNMASIYKKKNDLAGTVRMYEEVLSIDPREDRAFEGLMRIYILQNDRDKILQTARRIAAFSRNPAMAAQAQGIIDAQR